MKNKTRPKAMVHTDYLSLVGKTKSKGKRAMLIDYADRDQIEAIAECINNILQGNVPLTKRETTKLKRHKKAMRIVSDRRSPVKHKRNVLKQSGGFLSTLIPIAVSALGSLVSGLVNNK